MAKARVGIVKRPDGTISGRIIRGKEGPKEIVCVSAFNMNTAKAFIKSRGWTIVESEARGPRDNRSYCFYLGKKRRK